MHSPPKRALEQELETLYKAASGPEAPHNTAANQRAPETIPDALLAANRILVHRDGHVLLLSPLNDGPHVVLQCNPRFFTILIGDRDDTVHVQRLKPFYATPEPLAAPPRCGCPSQPPAPPPADAPPRGASSCSRLPHALLPPTNCMQFTLPPLRPPAEEPGTIFPSNAYEGFFARPGSNYEDAGRPQRLRWLPSRMDL